MASPSRTSQERARPGGRAGAEVAGTTPQAGWHWAEWSCELVGTAILMLGGLSAICLDFGTPGAVSSIVPDHSARLLVTGILFAGTGSLVAISPLGRRSGAHLNPSVTVAFWRRGHLHHHDLAGYIVSQIVGAFLGTAIIKWVWGAAVARVTLGVTEPKAGLSGWSAAAIEALMTAILIAVILLMVSSARTARWTPLAVWVTVAVLVWQGAPWTGTSLNLARSLAPAALAPHLAFLWVYLIGPLVGALLAVTLYGFVPGLETKTAKLYHDVRYPSILGSQLPVRPAGSGAATSRGRAGS